MTDTMERFALSMEVHDALEQLAQFEGITLSS